jgi:hypothetical protein
MHGIVVHARETPLLEQKMRQSRPSVHWRRQIPSWGKPMTAQRTYPLVQVSEEKPHVCMYVPVRKYKTGFVHTTEKKKRSST